MGRTHGRIMFVAMVICTLGVFSLYRFVAIPMSREAWITWGTAVFTKPIFILLTALILRWTYTYALAHNNINNRRK